MELAQTITRANSGLRAEDFDEIVRLNQRRIYRVLLAEVRDPELADSLTQECFVRAFKGRSTFRGEASVGTWLVRVAINLARDHQRSGKLNFLRRLLSSDEGNEAEQVADPGRSPEYLVLQQEAASRIWALTRKLPETQRRVFHLRYAEDMSVEEIAAATGKAEGTIKMHLHRAVKAVRRWSRTGEA